MVPRWKPINPQGIPDGSYRRDKGIGDLLKDKV